MIARHTYRVLHKYAKLVKPAISKYPTAFDLARDRSYEMELINKTNSNILNTTKQVSKQEQIRKSLGLTQKEASEISNTVVQSLALCPSNMNVYKMTQKLLQNQPLHAIDTGSIPIGCQLGHTHLKYHWSINNESQIYEQYTIDKSTGFIFNLPKNMTQNQLLMELGYQQVKNLQIKYCMLGLPAYAIVKFMSEGTISERVLSNSLEFNIGDHTLEIVTDIKKDRLNLWRRQLVIKGIQIGQTPVDVLTRLSQFGRVMNLELPLETYRQPTLKQVKEIYKNENNPIKINYHRANGTIESEYYPPLQSARFQQSLYLQKVDEYKRRLRYAQNLDVYEGKQNTLTTKNRGFCTVTYSCQQEAQNCYMQNRLLYKIQLKNGRQEFQFDDKHRQALLRYIDNSYIDKKISQNPQKRYDDQKKKQQLLIYQSLFMKSVHEKLLQNDLNQLFENQASNEDGTFETEFQLYNQYKKHLNQLKLSIGKGNQNPLQNNAKNNQYGKSFDDLAEQELYGMSLKERVNRPRYQVNIDDYLREKPDIPRQNKKTTKQVDFQDIALDTEEVKKVSQTDDNEGGNEIDEQDHDDSASPVSERMRKFEKYQAVKALQAEEGQKEKKIVPPASKGKQKFSTIKIIERTKRTKTLQQKAKAHMQYNRFVRDTINQYMGIFSVQKLQSELRKSKPTFSNVHSLKFEDGTEFITEEEVKNVLQYTSDSAQQFYNLFVRDNQIVKSFNIDIEETILKNFEQRKSQFLFQFGDIGMIKQEYQFKDDSTQIQQYTKHLNNEAEFGEQYRVVDDNGTKKLAKITKIDNIYPAQILQKNRLALEHFQNSLQFNPKHMELIQNNITDIFTGKPLSDELAQAFGLPKGTVLQIEQLAQQMCNKYSFTKKDAEKLINLHNYTEQKIAVDLSRQKQILKARDRRSGKTSSDFAKDPSSIKVKDREDKAIVSKFRQM